MLYNPQKNPTTWNCSGNGLPESPRYHLFFPVKTTTRTVCVWGGGECVFPCISVNNIHTHHIYEYQHIHLSRLPTVLIKQNCFLIHTLKVVKLAGCPEIPFKV